jgi:Pao retrotransposon peptidase.
MIKQVTFPRLQLFAAMIGTRLAVSVKKDFDQEDVTLSF